MNPTEHLLTCLGEEGDEIAIDAAAIQEQLLLLSQLVKTAGAMSQLTSKSLRFGLDDRNVLNPTGPTNRQRLVNELNDLLGVAMLCEDAGILPRDWFNGLAQIAKKQKVRRFMDYARERGTLSNPQPAEAA